MRAAAYTLQHCCQTPVVFSAFHSVGWFLGFSTLRATLRAYTCPLCDVLTSASFCLRFICQFSLCFSNPFLLLCKSACSPSWFYSSAVPRVLLVGSVIASLHYLAFSRVPMIFASFSCCLLAIPYLLHLILEYVPHQYVLCAIYIGFCFHYHPLVFCVTSACMSPSGGIGLHDPHYARIPSQSSSFVLWNVVYFYT